MDKYDELQKLQKLKDSEILTEKEFDMEKQWILDSINIKNKDNNVVRLDIIGIVLSIYSIILVYISFYIGLGIFKLDLLLVTIFSIISLLVNIKAKKQSVNKNIKIILSLGLSIIAIILILPEIFIFFKFYILYIF